MTKAYSMRMESLDKLFDLLRKERRRYVLYYLEQQNRPVPVEELVAEVARWEADSTNPSISFEEYEKVEISIHHADLPKLSDEPYIQYNPETRYVELTEPPPEFKAILAIAEVAESPRHDTSESEEE